MSEPARLRYLARSQWILIVLSILFGLQIAFGEGFRGVGLALVGLGVISFVPSLFMMLRARRLERDGADRE